MIRSSLSIKSNPQYSGYRISLILLVKQGSNFQRERRSQIMHSSGVDPVYLNSPSADHRRHQTYFTGAFLICGFVRPDRGKLLGSPRSLTSILNSKSQECDGSTISIPSLKHKLSIEGLCEHIRANHKEGITAEILMGLPRLEN